MMLGEKEFRGLSEIRVNLGQFLQQHIFLKQLFAYPDRHSHTE